MPLRTLIFISLLVSLKAQSQSSYFVDDPVWIIHSDCVYGDPQCHQVEEYSYYVSGDTIVSGRQYKKLMKFGVGSYSWWGMPPPPPGCTGTYMVGSDILPFCLVRDSARKIYKYGMPEELIHDFNLQITDTLSQDCYGPQHYWVQSIDTMRVGLQSLERFHLTGGGALTALMEGIGHDFGFLEYIDPLDCVTSLICYSRNDTAYFPAQGPGCQLPASSPADDPISNVTASIRDGQLCITNRRSESLTIRLYDMMGRCLLDKQLFVSECWEIGVQLGTFYVLEISSKTGRFVRKSIVYNY